MNISLNSIARGSSIPWLSSTFPLSFPTPLPLMVYSSQSCQKKPLQIQIRFLKKPKIKSDHVTYLLQTLHWFPIPHLTPFTVKCRFPCRSTAHVICPLPSGQPPSSPLLPALTLLQICYLLLSVWPTILHLNAFCTGSHGPKLSYPRKPMTHPLI